MPVGISANQFKKIIRLPVWYLTWPPAQSAHREACAIWPHNVSGDEEEA